VETGLRYGFRMVAEPRVEMGSRKLGLSELGSQHIGNTANLTDGKNQNEPNDKSEDNNDHKDMMNDKSGEISERELQKIEMSPKSEITQNTDRQVGHMNMLGAKVGRDIEEDTVNDKKALQGKDEISERAPLGRHAGQKLGRHRRDTRNNRHTREKEIDESDDDDDDDDDDTDDESDMSDSDDEGEDGMTPEMREIIGNLNRLTKEIAEKAKGARKHKKQTKRHEKRIESLETEGAETRKECEDKMGEITETKKSMQECKDEEDHGREPQRAR